jgi:hypothetical protein
MYLCVGVRVLGGMSGKVKVRERKKRKKREEEEGRI